MWGLLDRLFLGGGSGNSHHTWGFSPFKWAGWNPLWGSYTFKDFSVQKGEVTLHLLHNSFTLLANWHGCPPVGRSDFSPQYWRAWAYSIVFSLRTSLISQEVKIVFGGSWKLSLWRHSGVGGASQWSFIFFTSLAFWGLLNEAHIFCASLLQLGIPSNANNSLYQSGVSVISAFHVTHLQSSHTGSSGGGPSSSELSTDPLRKEVTPGSNFGSSLNSKLSVVASPSLDSGLS